MSEDGATPAGELRAGLAWLGFGAVVLVASIRMDRLEAQHINPVTVPGLLPGLLGIVMMLLGAALAVRSWRLGARLGTATEGAGTPLLSARLVLVVGLILVFAVGLVGHGVPFWLAATLYVTVSIVTLQRPQRIALGRTVSARDIAFALAVGLGSGLVITYVFQALFLVRLP